MKSRTPTFIIGFCVPMIAILVCFPFYNRIEPFVFGFSFNYFWIFSWLFLTSLCLYIAYRLDPYNGPEGMKRAEKNLTAAQDMMKVETKATSQIDKGGEK